MAAAVALALLSTRAASAQHLPLPDTLVALDSPEGQRLFAEADAKVDYYPLSEAYVTQRSGNFCGVASGVMVLGALQVPAPVDDALGTNVFTQEDFFNACARSVLSPTLMPGMTIDQLADLLQCHPARAVAVHAADTTLDAFRAEAAKNLATPGDFLVVNYDRAGLGQPAMGHISPLGAYDAKADKLLVMDVARYKYPPVWADTAAVFRAMSTNDFVSGKTRGYVEASAAPGAPGPRGAKARDPLRYLAGIVVAAFLLGALVGGFVQTRRRRRKARAA